MKTDDLIRALAADGALVPGARATLFRTLPVAIVVLAAVMLAALGLRPDAAGAMAAIAMKLLITLSLAAAALAGLLGMASHQENAGAFRSIMIAPLLAAGFVIADLATNGTTNALPRLIGTKSSHCMILIPLLSAIPLTALLLALKRGTPAAPAQAGALAGLAAAGIGASFYALNCMEDSPLFVASWYTIAALIVTAVGAALGSRLLR